MAAGSDRAGFTLVETLVSLAIAAVALTVLFSAIGDGVHHRARAAKLAEAGLMAQSLLDKAGSAWPLRPGVTEGRTDSGLAWRLRIAPYGTPAERAAWPVGAWEIEAEVSWGGEDRSVRLTTLRLGPKEGAR